MEDITRIPPHSVESEQSILGSILLDKDAMITVSEIVNPDDFYKEAHKIIYECTKCHEKHKNIMAIDDNYDLIIELSKYE